MAEYIGFQLDGLHAHHSSEDELLWPTLLDRAGLSAALIDRMERQHVGIHDAVETARSELAAWQAAPTSAAAESLAAALETDLDPAGRASRRGGA